MLRIFFRLVLTSVSSPAALQSATATLNSLASLSISSSVSPPGLDFSSTVTQAPTVPVAIPVLSTSAARNGISSSAPADDGSSVSGTPPLADFKAGVAGVATKNGKKRGTTFTCESCSKVHALLMYQLSRLISSHDRYIATHRA